MKRPPCISLCRPALALAVLLAFSGCALPPARPPIDLHIAPAQVEYRTFDPAHPPPHLIHMPDIERAFCEADFKSETQVHYMIENAGLLTVKVVVDSAEFSTTGKSIIWTPEGGRPEYLAHEEAHRAINDHYYRPAEAVARRICATAVGKTWTIPIKGRNEEAARLIAALEEEMIATYAREIFERCRFAQEQFDAITAHGQNPITNDEARAKALAAEEAHWAASH